MTNKKICVVGAGKWGKNHINTLASLNCLGGIIDNDDSQLIKFKDKYPSVGYYNRIEDSLDDKYDGYVIATNAQYHFENAKLLIENGHHILIEKPITLDSNDAIELDRLSTKYGVNLMVGHVLLFHPAFQKIKYLAY